MDLAAAQEEVRNLVENMFAAFKNHDTSAIEEVMDPDATLWDVFLPDLITGTVERQSFHEADQNQMQSRGSLTVCMTDPIIDAWDDVVLARYYLDFEYQPPNPTKGVIRMTDIMRRSADGRLRIIHHHEGMVPTGIPPINKS